MQSMVATTGRESLFSPRLSSRFLPFPHIASGGGSARHRLAACEVGFRGSASAAMASSVISSRPFVSCAPTQEQETESVALCASVEALVSDTYISSASCVAGCESEDSAAVVWALVLSRGSSRANDGVSYCAPVALHATCVHECGQISWISVEQRAEGMVTCRTSRECMAPFDAPLDHPPLSRCCARSIDVTPERPGRRSPPRISSASRDEDCAESRQNHRQQ